MREKNGNQSCYQKRGSKPGSHLQFFPVSSWGFSLFITPRAVVEAIKKAYPTGTRVVLVQMDDPQAPPVGTQGTVYGVDDLGDLLVH